MQRPGNLSGWAFGGAVRAGKPISCGPCGFAGLGDPMMQTFNKQTAEMRRRFREDGPKLITRIKKALGLEKNPPAPPAPKK